LKVRLQCGSEQYMIVNNSDLFLVFQQHLFVRVLRNKYTRF
jgi:hypothetical protein